MESIFTYLLIFGFIWLVSFILRKAGKKNDVIQNAANNNPARTTNHSRPSGNLEKILSELLGENYVTPQPAANLDIRNFEKEETTVKSGTSYQSSYENNTEEGGSLIEDKEKKIDSVIRRGKENSQISNPYISGLDIKKAIVYSEILQPKYF